MYCKHYDLACIHISDHPLDWSTRSLVKATHKSWGSWQHQVGDQQGLAAALIDYSLDHTLSDHTDTLIHQLYSIKYQLAPAALTPYAIMALAAKFNLPNPPTSMSNLDQIESTRLLNPESPYQRARQCMAQGHAAVSIMQCVSTEFVFSISHLCALSGVSRGGFYHHFDSLESARLAALRARFGNISL